MTHFDIGTLTDHLRGDDPPDLHARIAAHLAAGCAQCAQTLTATRVMLAFAERQRQATPPDAVVERARAIFASSIALRSSGLTATLSMLLVMGCVSVLCRLLVSRTRAWGLSPSGTCETSSMLRSRSLYRIAIS